MPDPRPLVPGAGPRPISTSDDVLAALPQALRDPALDPVRDTLVVALTALLQEWQYRSDYGAAQSDPSRAVEQYLAALGGDRGASKTIGEAEEAFRERAFQQRECVTERSIAAGVDAVLSLVTTARCALVDAALDGWFIHDGTDGNGGPPKWHSFVGAPPSYPDRYTEDDAVNNDGKFRPNSAVGSARVFSDSLGRLLLVRVPDVGFQLRDAALVFAAGVAPAEQGFFVGDGTTTPVGAFVDASSAEPTAIYRAIGSFLEAALGQSVRWEMTSDIAA